MRKRDYFILALALTAAVAVGIGIYWGRSLPTGAWGLSFRQEGTAPLGPAGAEELRKYDAAYMGPSDKKVIYLTFDAGYENGNTGKILDALKAHGARGCFFLVGNFVEKNPDLVKRMSTEGHMVGNHTMHHPDMSKISDRESFRKELEDLEGLCREKTGVEMEKYYRPPQGVYSEKNLEMARELGYKTLFWSLAYVDWNNDRQPTREEAFGKLMPRTHPGAVVLLHLTSKTNGEILDELLTRWEEMGYSFGDVREIF